MTAIEDDSAGPDYRTLFTRIVGVTAILIPFATAIGLQGDGLTRVARNHPVWFVLVAATFIGGVGLAVLGQVRVVGGLKAALGGFFLVALGFVGSVLLVADSSSSRERPVVEASVALEPSGTQTLTYSAIAAGVRTSDTLYVVVEGLHSTVPLNRQVAGRWGTTAAHEEPSPDPKENPDDPTEEWVTRLVYSFTGADSNGTASREATYVIPPGIYERVRVTATVVDGRGRGGSWQRCDLEARTQSCIAIALPVPPQRPSIEVSSQAGDTVVTAAAGQLYSADAVHLNIWTVEEEEYREFGTAIGIPDSTGNAATKITLSPENTAYCIVAELSRPMPEPPVSRDATTPSVPPANNSEALPAPSASVSAGDGDVLGGGASGAPDVPFDPCSSRMSNQSTTRISY